MALRQKRRCVALMPRNYTTSSMLSWSLQLKTTSSALAVNSFLIAEHVTCKIKLSCSTDPTSCSQLWALLDEPATALIEESWYGSLGFSKNYELQTQTSQVLRKRVNVSVYAYIYGN